MKITDSFKLKGELTIELYDAITSQLLSREIVKNLVVTAGKASIADALRGTASKGEITYCAVGTGTTAPAIGDTQLETELARKQISTNSLASKVVTFRTFYNATEANGTLREAGLFGDLATATANTGTLYCRTAINRVKSASNTLSLSWALTVG